MQYDPQLHSLQCPKCQHGMKELGHGDITVDNCSHCGGLWFDGDELPRLLKDSAAGQLDRGDRRVGSDFDRYGDILCPRCGDAMEKAADWRQTHIWYEVCRKHGIFLDAGEFKDLQQHSLLDRIRDLLKGRRQG